MPLDVAAGVLGFAGILGFVLLVRFLIGLARTDGNAALAWDRTNRWAAGVAAGIGSAGAVGLIEFGDTIGMLVGYIASHPFIVSNVGIAGLGAGALSGAITISMEQYLGLALMIVGVVFMLVEAEEGLDVR